MDICNGQFDHGLDLAGDGMMPTDETVIMHLFAGSAISPVDADGRMAMPRFVRSVIDRRTGSPSVILTPHESEPCIAGHDSLSVRAVHADQTRRRSDGGVSAQRQDAAARHVFGLAEEVADVQSDTFLLPAFLRRKAGIGELALIIGTGANFEIWDAGTARHSPDHALGELASWRVEEFQRNAR